jgi:hypothetical protein
MIKVLQQLDYTNSRTGETELASRPESAPLNVSFKQALRNG